MRKNGIILHILFLSSWYPSRVFPNSGNFIQRHAEAIATQHIVTAIHVVSIREQTQKITTDSFTKNKVKTHIGYVKYSPFALVKWFRFFRAYRHLLKKSPSFDFVHLNRLFPIGIVALYLKWIRKIPFLISEHWTGYLPQNCHLVGFTEKYVSKVIVRNAAFVCPVSSSLQQAMQQFGLNGNYHPIPNVVNTTIFKPSKGRKRKSFTLTHISRLDDRSKNITGILNVVKKLEKKIPEFQFQLVGDNPHRYKSLIDRLGIDPSHLCLTDRVSHEEIVSILQKTAVFVLFSNYESLPCVILEAFACGVPVVTSDVGGIREYFPDSFGYLVPPNNENALVEAIIKVYQNGNCIPEKMHNYAEATVGQHAICNKFGELYKQMKKPLEKIIVNLG